MDHVRLSDFVATVWAQSVIPEITEYIRIPNKSNRALPERRRALAAGRSQQAVGDLSRNTLE
ncbi:MAG: hypothetical protein ACREXS_00545 [Gammaproteobacteria bacterium]